MSAKQVKVKETIGIEDVSLTAIQRDPTIEIGWMTVAYGTSSELANRLERDAHEADQEGWIVATEIRKQAAEYLRDADAHGLERAAYITEMQVKDGARRRGVGTALMESALERMRNMGVQNMLVHYDPGTPEAGTFYRRFNFKTVKKAPATMLFEEFPMLEFKVIRQRVEE